MLHTVNRIVIQAPVDTIFRLASEVQAWPELLEHYRYVRIVEDAPSRRCVEMGATRSGVPVSWTSIQTLDAPGGKISYRHVGGVTKGMDVEWHIASGPGGSVVTIDHCLKSPRWWLRTPLANFIVGNIFVMHVAQKTLRGVKRHAEAAAMRAQK